MKYLYLYEAKIKKLKVQEDRGNWQEQLLPQSPMYFVHDTDVTAKDLITLICS